MSLGRDLIIGLVAAGALAYYLAPKESYTTADLNLGGIYRPASPQDKPRIDPVPEAVEAANQGVISVFPIQNAENWRSAPKGSGVYLGNGLAITNRHVIDGILAQYPDSKTVAIVYGHGGEETVGEAEILCVSDIPTSDFALIELPDEIANKLPPAQFSYGLPKPGDDMYVLGSGNGIHGNVVETEVIPAPEAEIPVLYREGSGPVTFNAYEMVNTGEDSAYPGNSGGAMVNPDGTLAAVTFAADQATAKGLGMPTEWLKDWAIEIKEDSTAACRSESRS